MPPLLSGIHYSDDKLLQTRIFSYQASQLLLTQSCCFVQSLPTTRPWRSPLFGSSLAESSPTRASASWTGHAAAGRTATVPTQQPLLLSCCLHVGPTALLCWSARFSPPQDTQRHRLGGNYLLLPVNAPRCPHHNNHHDGFMNFMQRSEEVGFCLQAFCVACVRRLSLAGFGVAPLLWRWWQAALFCDHISLNSSAAFQLGLQVNYFPSRFDPVRHAEQYPIVSRPIGGRRERGEQPACVCWGRSHRGAFGACAAVHDAVQHLGDAFKTAG